jgi:antitoxin component YwqK of YwqJK toxin-antitoxin module
MREHEVSQCKHKDVSIKGDCMGIKNGVVREYADNGTLECEGWYVDDKLHRDNEPAAFYFRENGQISAEFWYVNGKCHRDNGPADTRYTENGSIMCEFWYVNGRKHKVDGPAEIWYRENGQVSAEHWYVDGKRLSEDEVNTLKGKPKELECTCGAKHTSNPKWHLGFCNLKS